MSRPSFVPLQLSSGTLYDKLDQSYPSRLIGHGGDTTALKETFTHSFGIVINGKAALDFAGEQFPLRAGMYFSVPGEARLVGEAKIALFQRVGYRGLFSIGGPAEAEGRLCYIDNCRTTLLCPPPRNGDPCLNLLTFPANLKQSAHIHPTLRLGAVLAGSGHCVLEGARQALEPGTLFAIEPGLIHSFESGGDGLTVIAYHPDSEAGPTDQSHPMLNRTYLK